MSQLMCPDGANPAYETRERMKAKWGGIRTRNQARSGIQTLAGRALTVDGGSLGRTGSLKYSSDC